MTPTREKLSGSLLGLALGDALGAPYEGGFLERLLWRLMGRTPAGELRFTDDTQMSLDLAESLLAFGRIEEADVAARFAAGYRWSRGYGPGAAKVLKRIRAGAHWETASRSVYPEGSFGNGGAMRAPVVGLAYWCDRQQLLDAARRSAKITHAHPFAIEGASLIALATACGLACSRWEDIFDGAGTAVNSSGFRERLALAHAWLESMATPTPREVRARLGMGIVATHSCVTALYLALRFLHEPFDHLLRFTAACGGDVDTVGSMAGAIWGAHNGEAGLPTAGLDRLEGRARIGSIAARLYDVFVLAKGRERSDVFRE